MLITRISNTMFPYFNLWFILIISSNRKTILVSLMQAKICYIHMPTMNIRSLKRTNHFITLQVLWGENTIFVHRNHVCSMLWFIQKTKTVSTVIYMLKLSVQFPQTEQLFPLSYYIFWNSIICCDYFSETLYQTYQLPFMKCICQKLPCSLYYELHEPWTLQYLLW